MAKLTFPTATLKTVWMDNATLEVNGLRYNVKRMQWGNKNGDYFLEAADFNREAFYPRILWLIPQDSANWVADDTIL